jgi:peptidyl-tRNA hydrolase
MLKQYIFIPIRPRMSSGKIASQSCHATFLALEKENKTLLKKWKHSGMCVIVLACQDANHLLHIDKYLEQWNIIHSIYLDEGMTEVQPLMATALATGVVAEDKQWMFEQFKLFNDDSRDRFIGRLLLRR